MATIAPISATQPITLSATGDNKAPQIVTLQPNGQPVHLNLTVNTAPPSKPTKPQWFSAIAYLSTETFLQAALAYNQPVPYFVGAAGGLLGKYWLHKEAKPFSTLLADSAEAIPERLNDGVVEFSAASRTHKLVKLAYKVGLTYAATAYAFQSFGPLYAAYRGQALFGGLTSKECRQLASLTQKLTANKGE